MHGPRGGEGIIVMLILFGLVIAMAIGMMRLFEKAGKPGWAALIPIYNLIVSLQIVGKSPWLVFVAMIPFAGYILSAYLGFQTSLAFRKGTLFTIGAILLGPFVLCFIGYDDSEYYGPGGLPPLDNGDPMGYPEDETHGSEHVATT